MVVKGCLWKDMSELMGTKTVVFVIISFVNMAMGPFSVPCIINYIKSVELIVATKRLYSDQELIRLRHNDLIIGLMAHFMWALPPLWAHFQNLRFTELRAHNLWALLAHYICEYSVVPILLLWAHKLNQKCIYSIFRVNSEFHINLKIFQRTF